MRIHKLSWKAFDTAIRELAVWTEKQNVKNIYGIPRGGLVVAVALSHKTGLPLVDQPDKTDTLIVDDIIDSGHTISDFMHYHTAAVFCRRHRTQSWPSYFVLDAEDDFIVFPWETEKTAKVDYLEEPT